LWLEKALVGAASPVQKSKQRISREGRSTRPKKTCSRKRRPRAAPRESGADPLRNKTAASLETKKAWDPALRLTKCRPAQSAATHNDQEAKHQGLAPGCPPGTRQRSNDPSDNAKAEEPRQRPTVEDPESEPETPTTGPRRTRKTRPNRKEERPKNKKANDDNTFVNLDNGDEENGQTRGGGAPREHPDEEHLESEFEEIQCSSCCATLLPTDDTCAVCGQGRLPPEEAETMTYSKPACGSADSAADPKDT